MAKTRQPVSKTIRPWLRENLGRTCLAPLTGTDHAALDAAVHLLELYARDRGDTSPLTAFRIAVMRMQPTCHRYAFHAIAHVLDWKDRGIIWSYLELPLPQYIGLCKYEPGGAKRRF
ncbi:MAG: hypothetical protein EOP85_15380 [Verrucomicrobiaceae bacterium]|nr:MAG: hypothetical protein EOP85_15380 [Verrucomicrobiaceae bacterium]